MNDKQKNKNDNPSIQVEKSNWDFIPNKPEVIQSEINSMNAVDVLETLSIMKIIEATQHSSKATEYQFLGYALNVVNEEISHNAKRYDKLEFLKFIQEARFTGTSFQEVLKKVITTWDSHSF